MSGTQVTWLKIPMVGLPEMRCQIPVTKDGRVFDQEGEPLPHEIRTYNCNRVGHWMLGNVFLCQEHAAITAELMGDSIEDIESELRAAL